MSIFKKRIGFSQFIADLITYQFDFLENNFEKLIVLTDEFKVLTEKEMEEFLDKAHELIIVDILMSCYQQFHKKLSSEEVGEAVSIVYAKYLTEYKKIPKTLEKQKLEKVMELFNLVCKAEEETQERHKRYKKIGHQSYPKIGSDIDKQKFYLCKAFSSYCVGTDIKSENWEGRHFAAFKLAKGFVKGNIVAHALKNYTITFG